MYNRQLSEGAHFGAAKSRGDGRNPNVKSLWGVLRGLVVMLLRFVPMTVGMGAIFVLLFVKLKRPHCSEIAPSPE